MRRGWKDRIGPVAWIAGITWAILLGYILYPSLRVLWESFISPDGAFTFAHYLRFFDYGRYPGHLKSLGGSLFIAVGSVLLCALIGIPLAFAYNRYEFPGRPIFASLAVMPITLPPIVGVVSFYYLFGESGILSRSLMALFNLADPPFTTQGFTGVLLVHAYSMSVFFYLFTGAALRNLDQSLLDASRNLGGGRWRTFLRVVLPSLMPGVTAAALLVFMTALASFSAPYVFATDRPILILNIVQTRNNYDLGMAHAQTVILSLTSIGVLFLFRRAGRERGAALKGVPQKFRPVRSRWGRWTRTVAGGLLTVVLLAPHLTILLLSFAARGAWTTQILPVSYTLENYLRLLREASVVEPIRNSLIAASGATAATFVLGTVVALLVVRFRIRSRRALEILAMLPWALPGTVVAVNLLTVFSRPSFLSFGNVWQGTLMILALAYIVRYLPLVVRSGVAALEQQDGNLEDAARNLGASRLRALATIVLPLMAPALLAGSLLVFVSSLGEFIASILLWVEETKPLGIEIYLQFSREGNIGMACAYSTILIVLTAVVIVLSRRVASRAFS